MSKRGRARRHSRAYASYLGAKARCQNPNNQDFAHYGGRGIKFLYESFEQFLAELGERPAGMSIERINNDGNYEPGNCRYATQKEQTNNTRANRRLTAFGKTQTLAQWADEINLDRSALWMRVKLAWPIEEALTAPSGSSYTKNRMLTAFGETLSLSSWANKLNISAVTLSGRLGRGWPIEQALSASSGSVRANHHFVTAFGQTLTVSQWARKVGIKEITLAGRLSRGWTPERAIGSIVTPRQARILTAFGRTQQVAQWAREFNIHINTLWTRLQSGVAPEAALLARAGASKPAPSPSLSPSSLPSSIVAKRRPPSITAEARALLRLRCVSAEEVSQP